MNLTHTLSIPNILGLVPSYSAQQDRSHGDMQLRELSNVTVGKVSEKIRSASAKIMGGFGRQEGAGNAVRGPPCRREMGKGKRAQEAVEKSVQTPGKKWQGEAWDNRTANGENQAREHDPMRGAINVACDP
jgi:hypothetical protein